jgi:KDO2-lipid IV(A) lauroyltransferase
MKMALGVGRAVPAAASGRIVNFAAARFIGDGTSDVARASRVNQWVVSGGTLAGEALDAAVRENVRMMARFLYDLYHTLGDIKAEDALIVHDEAFEALVERERTAGPFVYSGVHFGNFDLMGRALGRAGWQMQVLSVADPNAGYEWQNDYRADAGFTVTPITIESLKQAARRLEDGESILTGHDRPLPAPDKVMPRFFGRPAPMPLLHVRLAMRAKVPVVGVAAQWQPDGRYRLIATDPIVMVGDRPTPEALLENAERCLAPIERWITDAPAHWAMPHIVWPDVHLPE